MKPLTDIKSISHQYHFRKMYIRKETKRTVFYTEIVININSDISHPG
jgi:hypothetical protein